MRNDSRIFTALALLLVLGTCVGVYFIYFDEPAPPPSRPAPAPEKPGEPAGTRDISPRDFTPEAAGRADPVVSKRPEQPPQFEKAVRRMVISGRVLDEAGAALADVRVEFQGSGELALFRGAGFTDPSGNYSLLAWERSNVRRGTGGETGGWVYAKAPDGRFAASEAQKFPVGPTATIADIELKRLAAIEGRVMDDSGAPAPFVTVTLRSMGVVRVLEESGGGASYEHRPVTRSAVADERGHFSFTSLPPFKYGLSVEANYYGATTAQSEVDASDGAMHWQELKLARQNWVRGTLLDQGGVPIEGAVVILRLAAQAPASDGKNIEASGDSPRIARRDGARGSDFRVSGSRFRSFTDAQGRFGFAGLADSEYELVAQLGRKTTEQKEVRINKEEYALTLAIECSVAGTVRDASTNLPVTRFDIRLFGGSENPTPFDRVNPDALFPPRDAGRYRLVNPPAGTIALRVSAPGYAPAVVNVENVAADERRQGVDVALKPLCDLTLTLKLGEKLLPREPVFLLYDGRSVLEASTDEFGEVRLPGVMTAEYTVKVQRADGSVLSARLAVPAQRTHAAALVLAP